MINNKYLGDTIEQSFSFILARHQNWVIDENFPDMTKCNRFMQYINLVIIIRHVQWLGTLLCVFYNKLQWFRKYSDHWVVIPFVNELYSMHCKMTSVLFVQKKKKLHDFIQVFVEAQGQLCLVVPVRVVNMYVQRYKTAMETLYASLLT